jgi:hypothetical protein
MTPLSSGGTSPVHGAGTWRDIEESLNKSGYAVLPGVLTAKESDDLAGMYSSDGLYRSRVIMARHGFGLGEYKYFSYPLPEKLNTLREGLYPPLAVIANQWNARMGIDVRYPSSLRKFLERCHEAGQTKPTPLILKYEQGDYNCLHQDLYGEHSFPLQLAILLAQPDEDFTGGEFVMTETHGTVQRAEVVPLKKGDGVIFTVNQRPVPGQRGDRKVRMRHGVSRVRSGNRHTIGLIFHDAQ